MKPETMFFIIHVPGLQFDTDFFLKAQIAVTSFGEPETGRGYLADPFNYDPGSAPEWSVIGNPELYHDCGGDGEALTVGGRLADALKEFIENDKAVIEQIESAIAKYAGDE